MMTLVHTPLLRRCLAPISLVLVAACSVAPGSENRDAVAAPAVPSGGTLAETTVPKDFLFKATRPVDVSIETTAALGSASASQRVGVDVTTQDDAVIYRGSVFPGSRIAFRLPLAHTVTALHLTLRPPVGAPSTQVVYLDPASSTLSVRLGGG